MLIELPGQGSPARALCAQPCSLRDHMHGRHAPTSCVHPPHPNYPEPLQDPSGTAGREMKEEMLKKIEKWQEPPPAKTGKVLPRPDEEVKKRRGGKRYRKMKVRGRQQRYTLGEGCVLVGACRPAALVASEPPAGRMWQAGGALALCTPALPPPTPTPSSPPPQAGAVWHD